MLVFLCWAAASFLAFSTPTPAQAQFLPPVYTDVTSDNGSFRIMLFTEETMDSALAGTVEGRLMTSMKRRYTNAVKRLTGRDATVMVLRLHNHPTSAAQFSLDRSMAFFSVARSDGSWFQEVRLDNRLIAAHGVDTLFLQQRIDVPPGKTAYAFVLLPRVTLRPDDEFYFFPVRYRLKRINEP